MSKYIDCIVKRVRKSETSSVLVPPYTEEDLDVRDRVPISNERPSGSDLGTNDIHGPFGKLKTIILILIASKYWSQWKMAVQRGLNTNMSHLQFWSLVVDISM